MEQLNWGMIGCGNVTENKSGPAFNKIAGSKLIAVMSRSMLKAKTYANTHNIPLFYDDAYQLINNSSVNAIYIATPPDSHEVYAKAAINAGKHIYIEKPMSLDSDSAYRIAESVKNSNIKASIAHYRREQPMFRKIKVLIEEDVLGKIQAVNLRYIRKPLSGDELNLPRILWRINPVISGGGLFHDLAPHQLDLLLYFFGNPVKSSGFAINHGTIPVDDHIVGQVLFENKIIFSGVWLFNAPEQSEEDMMEIIGTKGSIIFEVFQHEKFVLCLPNNKEIYTFNKIAHVQQPMIEQVVKYFKGERADNPCDATQGSIVMKLIDSFTGKNVSFE